LFRIIHTVIITHPFSPIFPAVALLDGAFRAHYYPRSDAMQLKSNRYKMTKGGSPFRQPNWLLVTVLVAAIGGLYYFDTQIVPTIPPPFLPTAAPTRSAASFAEDAAKLFQDGKLKPSIDMYSQAIQTDPTNTDLYIALSRVQVFYHTYPAALNNAQNAILRAKSALAYAVYGWALYNSGDLPGAEKQLMTSLSMDPNSGLTHAYHAQVLIDTDSNSWKEASQEAHTALSLSPNLLESHMAMGYVYMVTGNYPQAIDEYQAAILIHGKLADLYLPLGDIYAAQGLSQDARKAYSNALALDQTNPTYMARIARSYAGDGEFGKAQQYAEQAVQVAPLEPRYHALLGIMLYKNKDYIKSAAELELAIRGGRVDAGDVPQIPLTPGVVAEYYWTYGLALSRLDRCSEAIQVFTALQQSNPDDTLAQQNITDGLIRCKVITPTPTPKPEA
jgi:tetratricopeptide (TPR) repeat protein